MTNNHFTHFSLFRCDTCGDYVRCKFNKEGELYEDGHISKEEATALILAGVRRYPYTDCLACASGWRRSQEGRA